MGEEKGLMENKKEPSSSIGGLESQKKPSNPLN